MMLHIPSRTRPASEEFPPIPRLADHYGDGEYFGDGHGGGGDKDIEEAWETDEGIVPMGLSQLYLLAQVLEDP